VDSYVINLAELAL